MKSIFIILVLNLVVFSSYASVEINCTNGISLKGTDISFAGSNDGFRKGQFAVIVSDKNSRMSNALDQVAGRSSCSITPKFHLDVVCLGGLKFKIYLATFTPMFFNGGDSGILYSISVKTGNSNFSNIYDLVRSGTPSNSSIGCMIY